MSVDVLHPGHGHGRVGGQQLHHLAEASLAETSEAEAEAQRWLDSLFQDMTRRIGALLELTLQEVKARSKEKGSFPPPTKRTLSTASIAKTPPELSEESPHGLKNGLYQKFQDNLMKQRQAALAGRHNAKHPAAVAPAPVYHERQATEMTDFSLPGTVPIAERPAAEESCSTMSSPAPPPMDRVHEPTLPWTTDAQNKSTRSVTLRSKAWDELSGSVSQGCQSRSARRSRRRLGSEDITMDSVGFTNVGEDDDVLKERIQKAINKPNSNTTDWYRTTGVWQAVSKSHIFEQATLLVIIFNSIWIGVDTDYNKAAVILEANVEFQIVEQFFTVFFAFEWTVRYMTFTHIRFTIKDGWFVFDSLLVFGMVLETWVMSCLILAFGGNAGGSFGNASILRLLRLLRLSRMARMARLFRLIPELMVMVKGMAIATRSVLVTLSLLTLILYVFGITFTQLLDDTNVGNAYFKTVPDSMNTLLGYGIILEDTPVLINELGAQSLVYAGLFLLCVLLSTFTVLNMLVGVMVETTRIVSMEENERATISYAQDNLLRMLQTSGLDANGDQLISVEEFSHLMSIPDAVRTIHQLGVDVVNLVDQADYIFEKSEELKFQDFMEVVLKLRGTNQATVRDIVDMRKSLRMEVGKVMRNLDVATASKSSPVMDACSGLPLPPKDQEGSPTGSKEAPAALMLMDTADAEAEVAVNSRFFITNGSLDETWV